MNNGAVYTGEWVNG
jgi:hypothetical protein